MDARARDAAARVRDTISSYEPATTYEVKGDLLYVTVPGGIKPEQRALIKAHKSELLALFTEPPEPTTLHSYWAQVKEGSIPLLPSSFKQKVGTN
jgi:hypothetical protein